METEDILKIVSSAGDKAEKTDKIVLIVAIVSALVIGGSLYWFHKSITGLFFNADALPDEFNQNEIIEEIEKPKPVIDKPVFKRKPNFRPVNRVQRRRNVPLDDMEQRFYAAI